MVDAADSKSASAKSLGSSPSPGTNKDIDISGHYEDYS